MSGWRTESVAAAGYDRRTGALSAPLRHFCLLSSVLCLLVSGCAKRAAAPAGPVLRLSQRNEPATLDPHLATLPDEFFIIRALSEGLVVPNPDGGTPLPGVAERWETSADGLVWTFHLRPDAKWSNGDPVTAQDFAWSIQRALAPATAARKAQLFSAVQSVNAPDPRTLAITLKHATPDFLPLAASGAWLPVHRATVEKFGRDWTRPGHFVGNGPFLLVEWVPHQRIVVQRHPGYWDAGAVKLAAIHFMTIDSGDTEDRAFRAGQLDVTMTVPFSKLESYRRESPGILQAVALYETRYLALNVTRPPLNDLRVRRALSLALDRRVLVEKVTKSGQLPAYSFVPPGLGGYAPQTQLTEDYAAARRLLAEAGFPEGRGFPKLELSTWMASTTVVIEAIQQQWRSVLGIEVALAQREARTHLAALTAGDYDLSFVPAIPDYDSPRDLLDRLVTGRADNYSHWGSTAFDHLVASGDLPGAEHLLLEEMPLIPLYFNSKYFLRRAAVRGWREDALWTRYYKHVTVDEK